MPVNFAMLLVSVVAVLSPATALAYIDPGTGSILIQGIIAAIAAIGVTLKLYWHRVIAIFRRHPATDTKGSQIETDKNSSSGQDKPGV